MNYGNYSKLKLGISIALDGSEDNLFQNEGDDDPFEGFDEEDVRIDEEILANVSSFNEQNTEISDGEIASQDCLIHFRIKDLEGARLLPPLVFSTGPENSHSSYISDKCD
jgi:hypothetical protein